MPIVHLHYFQFNFVYIFPDEIRKCTVCETAVDAMKKILKNPKTDHSKDHVLEKSCRALPRKYMKMVYNYNYKILYVYKKKCF